MYKQKLSQITAENITTIHIRIESTEYTQLSSSTYQKNVGDTIKWEEFLLGANGNETKSDEMSSLQKKHCENASLVDEWSNEVKWWNGF